MTDEEVNQKFDVVAGFLATLATGQQKADERQQKADERQQKADERQQKADERIARLERVLMLAIRAGGRERKETREKFNTLVDAQIRTDAAMSKMAEAQSKMAEAQAHTDRRLDALIDIIQEGRNGKGNGQ